MYHSRRDSGYDGYTVGKPIPMWKEGAAQDVQIVLTEECNLRCKYCYITHKASDKVLSFETAKKHIDLLLSGVIARKNAVILEFIGGEPLIEMQLVDQICDYFKLATFLKNDDWYWNYRFSFSSNGVNYDSKEVQDFIRKNKGKVYIGLSIDGNKEKHDLQRVFPDGSGSYDTIIKNVPLWREQFGANTKATFASDDLPLLKDSIVDLWTHDIVVSANVVFEDVWKDGDDIIYEDQLKALADYAIDNDLHSSKYCTLFDESIGYYIDPQDLNRTHCGAGKMMALGTNGNIYPCIRYKDYSLNKKDEWVIGTVDGGIDMDKVRPFIAAMVRLQSNEECLKCEVASGCPFCQGFNYDEAETPTNFSRATYICKMHKARVRANNYYFARLFNKKGIRKKPSNKRTKRLYFLLSDSYVDYCEYQNQIQKATKVMTHEEVLAGLEFAHQHFYSPIFVHPKDVFLGDRNWGLDEHHILHLVPARFYAQAKSVLNDFIPVFCFEDVEKHSVGDSMETVMLNISASEISNLAQSVEKLLAFADRVHLNTFGLGEDFDLAAYEAQLNIISNCLAEHKDKEFNVISDYEGLVEHNNCKAGSESFAFAPGGNLFVCPGFYSNGHTPIGDPNNGITHHPNGHLFEDAYRPICERCDAHQCVGCSYTALLRTNEVNIPAALQCEKATIERNIAADFLNKLHGFPMIQQTSYSDPIERFIAETNAVQGYYRHNTK